MSCFFGLFRRKHTRDDIKFELQRPRPRNVSTTNKSASASSPDSSSPGPRQSTGSGRAADDRPRLYHAKTGFVGASAPVRPDSPMPQWGRQVPPRRKPLPRSYYPPRTEETRRTAPSRQQQRHSKPAFPPTVNTSRREDARGVGSSSSSGGGDVQHSTALRERRRHDHQQPPPPPPKQQASRRGQRSPTNAASVQPASPAKRRGKYTNAKYAQRDSACDVSRSRSGGRDSSRGNSDGISWADPPVSIPLRQHTLLDDREDDLYLDAAAAALGRRLYRYPDSADGHVERTVVRESFVLASEQLRARAARQLQRQQEQQEQEEEQMNQQRQKHQREHESLLRHAVEGNVLGGATAATACSSPTEMTRHEANMDAAAAALDRILESNKDSTALVHVGGARSGPEQSLHPTSGQQDQGSIGGVRGGGGGELIPRRRPTAESHVTREMTSLMAHVSQEMENHEREVRAGTYAPRRASGRRR